MTGWSRLGLGLALLAGWLAGYLGLVSTSVSHALSASGGTPVGGDEIVGCTAHAGASVTSGTGAGRRVALTFDDGPSLTQTPAILRILNRQHVHATFFEEGRHVQGREILMGEILASGDEIGNHSFHHPVDPGYGELSQTNRSIENATGFRPCLFRPPYGLVNAQVVSAAWRLGLEIVLWSVDSLDDKHPGAEAIYSNVISQAQPGSIILMHDGGHHPQTVRALPHVIRGLRARGFNLVTVTRLLGGRMVWEPFLSSGNTNEAGHPSFLDFNSASDPKKYWKPGDKEQFALRIQE